LEVLDFQNHKIHYDNSKFLQLIFTLLIQILLFVVKIFLFLMIRKFLIWSPPEWGVFVSRCDLRVCSTQGPRSLKNVVGMHVFRHFIIHQNQWKQGRENTLFIVAPKSCRGPPPSQIIQDACPPHAGPHKSWGRRPWPTLLML
jgi:hypothetical protein